MDIARLDGGDNGYYIGATPVPELPRRVRTARDNMMPRVTWPRDIQAFASSTTPVA